MTKAGRAHLGTAKPCHENSMHLYDNHRDHPKVERNPISDDTKMGIVLVVVALVALGVYAAILLIDFLISLMSS